MKRTIQFVLISTTLIILLPMMLPISSVNADNKWDIRIVDAKGTRGNYGNICPVAVDSKNIPHFAYPSPALGCKVTYASLDGSSWTTQTISDGLVFDLVIDKEDNPNILYNGLNYARWIGGNWSTQLIDPTVPNGIGVLALDSSGNPHVAYTDGQTLKYASSTGSNWNFQNVSTFSETQYGIPYRLSLAIDANDKPFILFVDHGLDQNDKLNVKLAVMENVSWNIKPVLEGYNLSSIGNMALDSQGTLHFVCLQNNMPLDTLLYASWNGSDWSAQAVTSNINLVNTPFLALDSLDNPHIVYVNSSISNETTELMYTSWTGKDWDMQTVNTNISPIGACYLAMDRQNRPHISYIGDKPIDSSYHPSAYIMYATTNETTPFFTASPTETPVPTQGSVYIIVLAVITFVTAVIAIIIWKKMR
jgi:hypothetical protein